MTATPEAKNSGPSEATGLTGKFTVTGLLLAVSVVVAWLGAASATTAAIEDGCNDSFVAPPEGPDRLVGFRQAVEDAAEPQLDIRLSWINRASNANCIALDVNFSTPAGAGSAGEWVLLETLADPRATQYLHQDVPTSGEVCYRVYSSNDSGRSDYSNRVCLTLEGSVPGTTPGSGRG